MERTFSHFPRVLVDMDITQQLCYKVLVERKDYAFFVDLEYENLPDFCSHCLKIGHHVDDCRLLTRATDVLVPKKQAGEVINVFKVVNDGRKKQGNLVNDPIVIEDIAGTSRKSHIDDPEITLQTGIARNLNETLIP